MVKSGQEPFKKELLTITDKYNDYILTALRTMWGIDLEYIENSFSKEMADYCLNMAEKYISYGVLNHKKNFITLTPTGQLVADNVMAELFWVIQQD